MTRRINGEGSYVEKKDKNDSSYIEYRKQFGNKLNGKPNIVARSGKNKKIAKERMDEYENSMHTSCKDSTSSILFKDFILEWIKNNKKGNVKQTTYEGFEYTVNVRIVRFCQEKENVEWNIANTSVRNLTTELLQNYFTALYQKYAKATVVKTYNLINECLSFTENENIIHKNPMSNVSIKKFKENALGENVEEVDKDIKFFTDGDISLIRKEACREFANGTPYYQFGHHIVFLIYTGIRIGEALALKWSNVDLDKKTLWIKTSITRPKNVDGKRYNKEGSPKTKNSIRIIPLSATAIDALKQIKKINGPLTKKTDFIFISKTGNLTFARNINRTIEAMEKRAGTSIQDSKAHSMRHTFASMLIRKGIDISVISKLLGHAKVSTTYNIYVHIIEEQKINAITALDDL